MFFAPWILVKMPFFMLWKPTKRPFFHTINTLFLSENKIFTLLFVLPNVLPKLTFRFSASLFVLPNVLPNVLPSMIFRSKSTFSILEKRKTACKLFKDSLQAVQILLNERFSRFIPCHHFVLDGSVWSWPCHSSNSLHPSILHGASCSWCSLSVRALKRQIWPK